MISASRKTDLPLAINGRKRPVRLLKRRILRGNNIYYNNTIIEQQIVLGSLAGLSNQLIGAGFNDRFIERFSTLEVMSDDCFAESFVQRLNKDEGIPFDEMILEATLTIESAIAYAMRNTSYRGFGRLKQDASPERFSMIWECTVPRMSTEAAALACLGIIELLPKRLQTSRDTSATDYGIRLARLLKAARRRQRCLNAGALAHAAQKLGLPCEVIGNSYLALGHGIAQRVIHSSFTGNEARRETGRSENSVQSDTSGPATILPFAGHLAAAETLLNSNGIAAGARRGDTLHRLLVINSTLVGALKIAPPVLSGDGKSTIGELIDAMNRLTKRRGIRHFPIIIDRDLHSYLEEHDQTITSVLTNNQTLSLANIASIQAGAMHSEITELVHPDYRHAALEVVSKRGLNTAAVDIFTADIARSAKKRNISIARINASPALWPYVWPQDGPSRNVGESLLKSIYPAFNNGRVPILLVVGQHGTNRVARVSEYLLRDSGRNTGLALKRKSFVKGKSVTHDSSLRRNAMRDLLRNYEIEIMIGTISFGEIMRHGLGLGHSDVALILDPEVDQDPQEYRLAVEVLINSTTSIFIVSSHNVVALELLDNVPQSRIILVSKDLRNPYLDLQRRQNGVSLIEVQQNERNWIAILKGGVIIASEQIDSPPETTDEGISRSSDHMFSLALAYAAGLPVEEIEGSGTDRNRISLNNAQRIMQ